jgi:hypothetical protein
LIQGQCRQALLPGQGFLALGLLLSSVQLPPTQARREPDGDQGRHQNDPAVAAGFRDRARWRKRSVGHGFHGAGPNGDAPARKVKVDASPDLLARCMRNNGVRGTARAAVGQSQAMKTLIVLALIGIVLALGSAGFFMLRKGRSADDKPVPHKQMARALAWRVGISVTLFLLVMLSWQMGWIKPSGLPLGR